jgi:cell division protein FtsB
MNIRAVRFDYLVSLGCLALLAYFAWHAWFGPRSHRYVQELSVSSASLMGSRERLILKKDALQKQVELLRPESVDPDMLEEMARVSLGWVAANELIIKTEQ